MHLWEHVRRSKEAGHHGDDNCRQIDAWELVSGYELTALETDEEQPSQSLRKALGDWGPLSGFLPVFSLL